MSETKSKTSAFLEKDMTRKEFLGFMGIAFLGIIGIGSLLTIFNHNTNQSSSNLSYGGGPYGGVIKQ